VAGEGVFLEGVQRGRRRRGGPLGATAGGGKGQRGGRGVSAKRAREDASLSRARFVPPARVARPRGRSMGCRRQRGRWLSGGSAPQSEGATGGGAHVTRLRPPFCRARDPQIPSKTHSSCASPPRGRRPPRARRPGKPPGGRWRGGREPSQVFSRRCLLGETKGASRLVCCCYSAVGISQTKEQGTDAMRV
jgi:hypothetical protein